MTSRNGPAQDIGRARTEAGAGPARGGQAGLTLAVILACQLIVGLDATVINVALPQMQAGLHFSATGLAWVFNAYTVTFGGLLLLGGRAGDILGRRRMLSTGVGLFTLASLLGGFATTSWWLIAARVLQGVGGALASPSGLALIATNFREGPARARALSLFSATSSASLALGLIIGGMLTDWLSWRWVLFVNVPIGIAIILLAPRFVRETERVVARLDLAGAITGTLGVASLVYAFLRASTGGWGDSLTLGAFAAAAVLLAAFVVIELRTNQPIMPLRLFADRNRAGGYLTMLLVPATVFDIIYFLTQFLQDVLGYSPLRTGFAFLPMTVAVFATVRLVPILIRRWDTKPVMVLGTTLVTGAMVWLSRLSSTDDYVRAILGPLLLAGAGVGLATVTLAMTILAGVPHQDAGAASGLLQTMQWIGGGSLGLAILVTVQGTATRNATQQGPDVLTHGIASAFSAGTILTACAIAVSAFVIKKTRRPADTRRQAPRP
jgi:EmrB/QacA subfamily drug resistance transporter